MTVVETKKLQKSYGSHPVLKDVDIRIGSGRLVGFLGPNGAGKTTTIRILLGLLKATAGSATIFGKCCRKQGKEIRREVGYLPGDVHMYPGLSGLQTLKFFARARKLDCQSEIKRLGEAFELDLRKTVRAYSTGMRQKLGLIQALMHRPNLLVLDEPTSSLDPLVRKTVFRELRNVVDEGRTVLFSSHSLGEVEELCDEVIVLREGRIVEHQPIEVLKNRAMRRVEVAFDRDFEPTLPKNIHLIEKKNRIIKCTWTGDIKDLLNWLGSLPTEDVVIERPDLNDLFIAYYESGDSSTTKSTEGGLDRDV